MVGKSWNHYCWENSQFADLPKLSVKSCAEYEHAGVPCCLERMIFNTLVSPTTSSTVPRRSCPVHRWGSAMFSCPHITITIITTAATATIRPWATRTPAIAPASVPTPLLLSIPTTIWSTVSVTTVAICISMSVTATIPTTETISSSTITPTTPRSPSTRFTSSPMATSSTHWTTTRVSITPPANHPSSFVHSTTTAGYVPQLSWHFLTSSFQHFYELLCILAILFRKECMSLASCTCPACSPNAMHIILHSSWEVIIDHHPEFRQQTGSKGLPRCNL